MFPAFEILVFVMEREESDNEHKDAEMEGEYESNYQQEARQEVVDVWEEQEDFVEEIVQNQGVQIAPQEIDPNLPHQKPKKPLTPYMLFIKRQKQHTAYGDKFNLKLASQVWNGLTPAERAEYHNIYAIQKEAYDEYIRRCVEQGINFEEEEQLDFVFPIARVRAIMRQDPTIAAKGETVIAMNKAVEFFGEHLLAAVAKTLPGKKKVEASDLWEAINSDKMLWFLRPLIDQKDNHKSLPVKNSGKSKQTPNHISLELQHEPRQDVPDKLKPVPQKSLRTKQPNQYQMKLTDMFHKQ